MMIISKYEVKISNVNIFVNFSLSKRLFANCWLLFLVDNIRTRDHSVSPVRTEFSFCWVEMLNTIQRHLSGSAGLSSQKENKIDDRKYTVSLNRTIAASWDLFRLIGRMEDNYISLSVFFRLLFLNYFIFFYTLNDRCLLLIN